MGPLGTGFQTPVHNSCEIGEALLLYLVWRHLHPLGVDEHSLECNTSCGQASDVMKYSEVDMQEIPRQMSPLTQVQNNMHGIPDRSNWRSKNLELSNGNGIKDSPEIIDLDSEESPVKEMLDNAIAVNGVTTTVKKVSLPWQDKASTDEIKKSIPPREEDEPPRNQNCENSTAKELLQSPEAEENIGNKVSEGGGMSKKKSIGNENSQVMKGRSINKRKVVDAQRKSPDRKSKVVSNSAQSKGERKRPSPEEVDDGSSKKLRTSDVADESPKMCPPAPTASEVNGLNGQDAKKPPQVSLVDLVDEEDDISVDINEKPLPKEDTDIVEPKNVSQTSGGVKLVSSESSCVSVESASVPSPSLTTGPESDSIQSSSSLPVEDLRTKLISSSVNSGTSVVLTQMQPLEVKKVKLCPSLEKQATAMSSGVPITLSSSAESSKLVPTSSSVQNQVATSTTSQDDPDTPKKSSSEAAKETLVESETPVCGSDLEKKLNLNPVHSLTRKTVRKLTRAELEAYLLEVTCELVFSKSEAGKYRRMYEEMKEISENKSMKLAHLVKQVSDLKAVVAKVVDDQKERRDVIPHRITRSVGLQLDYNNIANALKLRSKGDRLHIIAPTGNSSLSNSPPSNVERPPQQRWNRSTPSSTSNTVVSSTPNGADAALSSSSVNKSPQRQLRAIHPKLPQNPQSSSTSQSTSNQPTAANEQSNKMPGFIDISDEGKVSNTGASVGIKRHKQAAGLVVANSQSPSTSTNVNINAVANNQAPSQTMKVVQQHYGQPGNVYSQTSGAPRMITPMNIPSTAPVNAPRLAYIIPTTRPMQPQQRQILLTSPASAPQIRGPSPTSQVNPVQTMLMRPNTIVQVSSGAISSPSTTFIRTIPNNPIQTLPAVKNPQQHASRVMSMQPRQPVPSTRVPSMQHPAPLPSQPQPTVVNPNLKPIPRRPVLKLSKVTNGIVLSWNMTNNTPHEEIASYQLYAYQEGTNTPPSPSLWKKVGDVKALPLPMACTLTQFADGHRYHFAVRALDVHGRVGEFSVPGTIDLFN
ncbi:hypothetical protein J437_LFUL008287 [Ladona fulva]|uniref:Fibronectin type-III domain-containing protein n=1 Tax=Ladona fulva TaxID=123851 RepID=A0A8K0P077_LADFU|nr:hypothetical protein J437_LFUL008287 [Ladona fulva]